MAWPIVGWAGRPRRGWPQRTLTTRRARLPRTTAVVATALAVATSCSSSVVSSTATTTPPAKSSGVSASASNPSRRPAAGRPIIAAGHGWTPRGLDGPIPPAHSCHYRHAANGEPLPDPACTPGAIDPAVTQHDLDSTVCRPGGYTDSVRPPESLTEPVKLQLLDAYGVPRSQAGQYELDHLEPLDVGGASDVGNLWPEPNQDAQTQHRSAFVHNDKDAIEAKLRDLICSGAVSLGAVQRAMASDWATAPQTLHLSMS